MNKMTVRDVDLKGKRVIMRVDFNVPLDGSTITDDTRIRAALPTIEYVLEQGASLVLMSHLGRPKGKAKPEFSLKPVGERLAELLDRPVAMAPDCIGDGVAAMAAALEPGQVLLLENTRFHNEEEGKFTPAEGMSNDEIARAKAELKAGQKAMAKQLAALGDVYVNDAFGSAHRAHASTAIITEFAPVSVAGFLLEKEIEFLSRAVASPARPFVAVIGGAKVSGKLEVLKTLISKVDTVLIGGGMAYTFLKSMGRDIAESICEDDLVETAGEIMANAKAAGVTFLLPTDNVVADAFSADARTQVLSGNFPAGWMGMDIGPETVAAFTREISEAKTIVWNGPLGCFEMKPFATGTMAICNAIAESDAVSIIGGGDSASAVNISGLADKMTHISTGGGASLELLEGKALPGLVALTDKA